MPKSRSKKCNKRVPNKPLEPPPLEAEPDLKTEETEAEPIASSEQGKPYQPIHLLHFDELNRIWPNDRRIPSANSRRAWALARNLNPTNVHSWWYRRRKVAKKGKFSIPKDTYELDVGIPPELPVVKEEPVGAVALLVSDSAVDEGATMACSEGCTTAAGTTQDFPTSDMDPLLAFSSDSSLTVFSEAGKSSPAINDISKGAYMLSPASKKLMLSDDSLMWPSDALTVLRNSSLPPSSPPASSPAPSRLPTPSEEKSALDLPVKPPLVLDEMPSQEAHTRGVSDRDALWASFALLEPLYPAAFLPTRDRGVPVSSCAYTPLCKPTSPEAPSTRSVSQDARETDDSAPEFAPWKCRVDMDYWGILPPQVVASGGHGQPAGPVVLLLKEREMALEGQLIRTISAHSILIVLFQLPIPKSSLYQPRTDTSPYFTMSATSPATTSATGSARISKTKIPRPPNCFLIYRREKARELRGELLENASRIIGRMWEEEPEDVKEVYRERAKEAKKEHARRHPDYRYRPSKKGEGRKKKKTQKGLKNTSSEVSASSSSRPNIPPYYYPDNLDSPRLTGWMAPAGPLPPSAGYSPHALWLALSNDGPSAAPTIPFPDSFAFPSSAPQHFPALYDLIQPEMMVPPMAPQDIANNNNSAAFPPAAFVPAPEMRYAQWPPMPIPFVPYVRQDCAPRIPVRQAAAPAIEPPLMPSGSVGIVPPFQQQQQEAYEALSFARFVQEQNRVEAVEQAFYNSELGESFDWTLGEVKEEALEGDSFPFHEYIHDFGDD